MELKEELRGEAEAHRRNLDTEVGFFPSGLLERAADTIEALQRDKAELQKSQWISVEDRLPDDCRVVIVEGGAAYYDEVGIWRTFLERFEDGSCRPIQWSVTHWMPLPEPPK